MTALPEETEVSAWGGNGVDKALHFFGNTSTVFWTERHNSYVICPDTKGRRPSRLWHPATQQRVVLVSINGIGEVRWTHEDIDCMGSDGGEAVEYFGLQAIPQDGE